MCGLQHCTPPNFFSLCLQFVFSPVQPTRCRVAPLMFWGPSTMTHTNRFLDSSLLCLGDSSGHTDSATLRRGAVIKRADRPEGHPGGLLHLHSL